MTGQCLNRSEAVMLSLSPCCLGRGRFYEAVIFVGKGKEGRHEGRSDGEKDRYGNE